jgi:hypothetical protein
MSQLTRRELSKGGALWPRLLGAVSDRLRYRDGGHEGAGQHTPNHAMYFTKTSRERENAPDNK